MTDGVVWHGGHVDREARVVVTGGRGATVWLTGLPGSGKSTIAHLAEALLVERGRAAYTLDGDNVRHGLNSDLGFSPQDRSENVRRVGEVARLMADAGLIVFASLISPYRADRDAVRLAHVNAHIPFYEVYVATPLAVCEERDPKDLYRRARTGSLAGLTGVDDPYEAPISAELTVDTSTADAATIAGLVLALVEDGPT